ncbi:hypothetical protein FIBSPDRAFT_891737 [Athelia psychrophila]|uniref:DUF6533 domain-containing protein n=1 Tax=Athelia psychrophila TaxID=1759441 RepID=A0A166J9W2_9AGAM|nr:hypothetical protein FIBSPDRAFT_891737 [Fibularhizoctonia sp. CBS 109695]
MLMYPSQDEVAAAAPVEETSLAVLLPTLLGSETARYVGIVAFVVLVYDHLLTLDEEIKYFWTGKWTMSRLFYFLFCKGSLRMLFTLTVICMLVAEAVLVLRIWYLYRHSPMARLLVILCFCGSVAASFTLLYYTAQYLNPVTLVIPGVTLHYVGCMTPPPPKIWALFIPALVLHTILYLFTAYRGVRNRSVVAEAAPIMSRLLRDGGMLYVIVLVSVGFATVGSAVDDPTIRLPIIYSNIMLSLTSTVVSRIMLSIRSLAAELTSNPSSVLLNNTELSRVQWRKGNHAGDILVDMGTRRDHDQKPEAVGIGMQVRYERTYEYDLESVRARPSI